MVTQEQIQNLVNEIAENYQPEKIYLFGSYANGVPNDDSDIDLFIVKETDKNRTDRTVQILSQIKNYPNVGCDFIIYTPMEFELASQSFLNIGNEAVKTGKLLYERL